MNDTERALERDRMIRTTLLEEAISLPEIVREKLDVVYADLPNLRKNIRIRKVARQIALAFIAVMACLFSVGLLSPVTASYLRHLPVIGSAFKTAGDVGLMKAGNELSGSFERQTAEDKGVSITLDQIVYDGTRISIGFLHDSKLQMSIDPRMIHIKGESVSSGLGGVSKEVVDGMMATVLHFSINKALPVKFTLGIQINEVSIFWDGKTEKLAGDWSFHAPVEKMTDGLMEQKFNPPLIRSINGIKIAVTGITVSPFTTKVSFDLERPEDLDPNHIHSQNGNEEEETLMKELVFKLVDSKGLELEPLSVNGSRKGDGPEHINALFAPLTGKDQELVLQTVLKTTKVKRTGNNSFTSADMPEVQYIPLPTKYPVEVSQGEAGYITFEGIEIGENGTFVTYKVDGSEPYTQDNAWWIQDSEGIRYQVDRYEQIRLRDDAYVYRAKLLGLPKEDSIRLAVMQVDEGEKIPELEVSISLQR